MFELALYEPEIPQNAGNVIRLCANLGARLHLIQPLGFVWDDKRLRRAGLDYHALASVTRHADYPRFLESVGSRRLVALSSRASSGYASFSFADDDVLMFGPETRGLPDSVLESIPAERCLRIPMVAHSRSLNLSNACAVVAYEAWRQLGFPGTLV